MAQSNEGQKEPKLFPNAQQGQGTSAKKNTSVSGSKKVPAAASIFVTKVKQPYSGVMADKTNKKASDF